MEIAFAPLAFIFGLIVGSFLNVVILRYNTGWGVGGRSACMICVRTLDWYELIPVFSYLFLLGRCRGCLSRISSQYPLVELLTGLTFLAVYLSVGDLVSAIFGWIIFSLFMVITVYDYRHFIIPDGVVYTSIAVSFLYAALSSTHFLLDIGTGIAVGGFFALLWAVSGGRWMGFGDAKLGLAIGWFLPYPLNVTAILLAFWTGAAISLFLLLVQWLRRVGKYGTRALGLSLASEIPFGPFMVFGALVAYVTRLSIW